MVSNYLVELFLKNYSTLIRHYRTKRSFTQLDLANKIGMSLRTYQRIELGETEPSISQLYRLSDVLNFKFEEIFHFQKEISDEQKILSRELGLLEQINQTSRVGGWELDVLNERLFWTKMTKAIHGVADDFQPTLESSINFFQEGKSRHAFQGAINKAIENGRDFELQLDLMTAAGNKAIVLVVGKVELSQGRSVRLHGIFQDITKLKSTEIKLEQSLERIEEMKAFAQIGIWELDIPANILSWTKSQYQIFEIDSNQFEASYEGFLKLVHPEDREKVNFAYTNSLKTQLPYEIIHRLLMPDGRIKFVVEHCKTTFDKDGNPLRSLGYTLDVTRFRQ